MSVGSLRSPCSSLHMGGTGFSGSHMALLGLQTPSAPGPCPHLAHLGHFHRTPGGSSTARQPLPEEEATEVEQRGDATPPATSQLGPEQGLKPGCPPPSSYFKHSGLGPISCGVTGNTQRPQDTRAAGLLCLGSRLAAQRVPGSSGDSPPPPGPGTGRQLTDIGHIQPVVEKNGHDGHGSSRDLLLQGLESFEDLLILRRQLVLRDTLEAIMGGSEQARAWETASPTCPPLKSKYPRAGWEGSWQQRQNRCLSRQPGTTSLVLAALKEPRQDVSRPGTRPGLIRAKDRPDKGFAHTPAHPKQKLRARLITAGQQGP